MVSPYVRASHVFSFVWGDFLGGHICKQIHLHEKHLHRGLLKISKGLLSPERTGSPRNPASPTSAGLRFSPTTTTTTTTTTTPTPTTTTTLDS